jgi:diguanylate cyclase (GGDEF)-like protein/hemerythrin-like metal-binding protein
MERVNQQLRPGLQPLKRLIDTGCSGDMHYTDRQTVQLTNAVVLARLVTAIPFGILFASQGPEFFWPIFVPYLIGTILIGLTILFNARGLYLFAGVWGNLINTLQAFSALWLYIGYTTGAYFYFLLYALVPIITLPRQKKLLIAFLSSLNLFFFMVLHNHQPILPIPFSFSSLELSLVRQGSIFSTMVLIVVAFYTYQQILHRNERQLDEKSIKLNELLQAATTIATTDSLTRLANRRRMEELLQVEIARALRYSSELSLIMFDLDHFKRVNDTLGHDVGDQVLIRTGELALSRLRSVDICGRWGGEEFLIILPHTGLEGALLVAEKIRLTLETAWHDRAGIVTGSFGVAEWATNESYDTLIKRVDNAMYRAKNGGRNLVSISIEQLSQPRNLARLIWMTEWETGEQTIDSSHQKILTFANRFLEHSDTEISQIETISMLDEFEALLKYHFAYEEELLVKVKYPELEHHKMEHQQLMAQLAHMRANYQHTLANPVSLYVFITDEVVVGHLINTDIKYFPYIEAQLTAKHL